jgi:hypothetical protein
MKTLIKFLTLLILLPLITDGQGKYQITGVKVVQHGDTLSRNAWVGGFNNPILSSIDLNQDGLLDLFIYDKAAWKGLSFINTGSAGHPSYTYAPEYDRMYPTDLRDWAVMRDYNHDGVYDIFSLSIYGGIEVYKGYRNGNDLTYQVIYPQLSFPFGNFSDHIWTFSDNMPIMMDIDGDGALDVVAPDINAVNLDFCRNIAVDSGYSPDSLVFQLYSQCWGQFSENSNDCNVTLNAMCKKELEIDTTSRDLRHQGGACWGTHYRRSSPLVSVFIADIYCDNVKFLHNTGDSLNAYMSSVDTLFPSYDVPVNMSLFPGTYGLDADNDGFEDLMFAPFASNYNVPSQSIDINVMQYYHNNGGTDTINTYHYEGDTLLNNSVVDVGSESHPVFFDYNGDGLMDMVIGRYGQFVSPGNAALSSPGVSISSLELYKNIGSDTVPMFELVDTDWNGLSQYDATGGFNGMFPAFGDLDGDGKPDMVVGDFDGNISFFHNAGSLSNASYPAMTGPNWFGIDVGYDAAPFIYDVNGDGLNDLVIGESGRQASLTGSRIHYYWNFGTATNPQFSPDSSNNFFGNVRVWDYALGIVEGFPTPVIRSENGSTVLYSGSDRGITFKYLINPDSLRGGTFRILDSNVLGIKVGRRSNVSIADINHDGKNDYLVGNIRGGIMLFSDTAWVNASSTNGISNVQQNINELLVYPNPARDKIICRVGSGTQQLVSAQLFDILGTSVSTNISQNDENGIVLAVGNVAEGIYIIQASDKNGKTYQQKVSIIK